MERTEAKEKLAADFQVLMDDAKELMNATKDDMSDRTKKARTRLEESLRSAQSRIGEANTRITETTEQMVKEHPFQSLGTTLFIGFLLGFLIRGRNG
jgi:ElaB/YqjD/DUF883 family membrane-anchored ribosome-binding protein